LKAPFIENYTSLSNWRFIIDHTSSSSWVQTAWIRLYSSGFFETKLNSFSTTKIGSFSLWWIDFQKDLWLYISLTVLWNSIQASNWLICKSSNIKRRKLGLGECNPKEI